MPAMRPTTRIALLSSLAMLAFAGNSLLCRTALRSGGIDPASFTSIRIVSGALVLWLIVRFRKGGTLSGSWISAAALFVYAAAFSFAYLALAAGTGALLLFGAVQVTMISHGLWSRERLPPQAWFGFIAAFGGLVGLLLPGLSAPPLLGAAGMLGAGVAWGVYSLRGKGQSHPTAATAGNFVRAVPPALVLSATLLPWAKLDVTGILCAVASGAMTSGLGYVIWYAAVRGLRSASAAAVQLSVPVITALGGVALLGEPVTLRLLLASTAVLGGIALVIFKP